MSNSNFCSQQRQQEEHKSRKLLAIGLFGSIVLHGAISSAAMRFNEEPKESKKPIELIIVDAPKPVPAVIKPKPEPQKQVKVIPPPPIPEPQKQVKVTPPPIPEPQPIKTQPAKPRIENRQTPARSSQPRVARVAPKPQAIKPQTITPPSPNIQPSPVQPSRPPVNPTPIPNTQPQQQVLTGSNSSAPQVSVPDTPPSGTGNNGSFSGSSQSISGLGSSLGGNSQGTGGSNAGSSTPVAARPTPKPTPKAKQALKCVSGCKVAYPSALNGVEGTASVKVTVDSSGNVVNADLARSHSNSQINEQAIIAAQKMKFAPRSGESTASVRVTINFTVAGSDFERQARERQQQNERQRQAREQQQQQERQAREQQERQQQLERQAREQQQQLERQQQLEQPSPEPNTDAIPTPNVPDTPEL